MMGRTKTSSLATPLGFTALWGIDATAALLRRLVGDRLSVLDAGCCGMAGAFGYTADHYDLSMQDAVLLLESRAVQLSRDTRRTTVHRIVSEHNGEIKVESTPGETTEFRIVLPLFADDIQLSELESRHKNSKQ